MFRVTVGRAAACGAGAEMANRLLDVRGRSRRVAEPASTHWFASVMVALGAIEGPGMAAAKGTVARVGGLAGNRTTRC